MREYREREKMLELVSPFLGNSTAQFINEPNPSRLIHAHFSFYMLIQAAV